MKKFIYLLFILMLVLFVPGCGETPDDGEEGTGNGNENVEINNLPKFLKMEYLKESSSNMKKMSLKKLNDGDYDQTVNVNDEISILIYLENTELDSVVDIVIDDSHYGENCVYTTSASKYKINRVDTEYSSEYKNYVTEIEILVPASEKLSDRTITIKKIDMLREIISEVAFNAVIEKDDDVDLLFKINNMFTINYIVEGSVVKSEELAYKQALPNVDNPEIEGYIFNGWYTDPEFTTEFTDTLMPNINLDLYAKVDPIVYTVSCVDNTSGTVSVRRYDVIHGQTTNLPDIPREGFVFKGWCEDKDGNGPCYTSVTPITKSMTVYPIWEVAKYKIIFDTDGGSPIESLEYEYNEEVKVDVITEKTGYTFVDWDGTIPAVMPSKDITLKAKWSINSYTIKFNSDGGSEVSDMTVVFDSVISYPANPEKEGHTFIKWEGAVEKMPASDLELTAVWEVNKYVVSFNTDGGNEIASYELEYGSAITLPSDPVKEGHTFIKWEGVLDVMPANNVEIKAVWEINTYHITFKHGEVQTTKDVIYNENLTDIPTIEFGNDEYWVWDIDYNKFLNVSEDMIVNSVMISKLDSEVTKESVKFNVSKVQNESYVIELVKASLIQTKDNVVYDKFENDTFSGLLSDNEYTIELTYNVTLLDGKKAEYKLTEVCKTLAKETPVFKFDEKGFETTKVSHGFKFEEVDNDQVGQLKKLTLTYIDNLSRKEVVTELPLDTVLLDNLYSNMSYSLKAYYEYDLNDGTGVHEINILDAFLTEAYTKPEVKLEFVSSSLNEVNFNINVINDIDNLFTVKKIELYEKDGKEALSSLDDLNKTSIKLPEVNKEYVLKLTHVYDLNIGYTQTEVLELAVNNYKVVFNTNCDILIDDMSASQFIADETLPALDRKGYVFVGWYNDETCLDKTMMPSSNTTVTNEKNLYARWVETSEVFTYDVKKDGVVITGITSEYKEVKELYIPTYIENLPVVRIEDVYYEYETANGTLEYVYIPKFVKVIDTKAFANYSKLKTVEFAKGSELEKINSEAFAYCSVLSKIVLPNGVKEIGEKAFYNCTNLPSIIIPESVVVLGNDSFGSCSRLKKVIFKGVNTEKYSSNAISGKMLSEIIVPEGAVDNYSNVFNKHANKIKEGK